VLDLVIEGGTAVLPEFGILRADVGIANGKIAMISGASRLPRSRRRIDASGLHLLPGIIDPHAHFGPHVSVEKDIEYETRAALAGGVTTIGWFVRSPDSYHQAIPAIRKQVAEHASTDMFAHFVIATEEQLGELRSYVDKLGVTSFKAYTAGPHAMVDDDFLFRLFQAAAEIGPEVVVCVHAENDALVEKPTARLRAANGELGLSDWSRARHVLAGAEAIRRCAFLADVAGARTYVVHVNSSAEVDQIREAKSAGKGILAEAGSHYLSLTVDHPLGALLKRTPPIRSEEDVNALWRSVADATIDTIGTDNVVGSRESNQAEKGILEARQGFTMLGLHLPVALHEGYHLRRVPLTRIVEAMSVQPARIFGLYPGKGTIAVGSDADIVVVDLDLEREVDYRDLHTWSDFTPWDSQRLKGWPVMTIRTGLVAVENNRILIEPGSARYLQRGPLGARLS
jgi:dihydropyrimidinase